MSEEDLKRTAPEAAASEPADDEPEDMDVQEEPKMVPLAALQAERKKRQFYEEQLAQRTPAKEEAEDLDALVEKRTLKNATAEVKREVMETLYQDMNPKAVQEIEQFLKPILEKKPWLASSVDTAQNRYARAYEIVQDYKHLVDKSAKNDTLKGQSAGQRIVANAQKPGSPADIAKSAPTGGAEFMKSMQGTKEFRDYRQKMLSKR